MQKKHVSRNPWGGRRDPVGTTFLQLVIDIFSTRLWPKFAIIVLREVKHATDPQLTSILSKVRLGICDNEVLDVLQTRFQSRDVCCCRPGQISGSVQLLPSPMKSMQCLERLQGNAFTYEARDTGHDLRKADYVRL